MAKQKREFYELPNVTTSTDIINAARHSIKAVSTSRPFTPSENKRSLYTTRPTSSGSSVDLSDISANPRILSPIEPSSKNKLEEPKKKEADNFDAYWRAKIAPILGSLNMELENLDTLKQVEELSDCLLRGGFLTGSVVLPHQYKVKVFQSLINLLDRKDTRLLLKISRFINLFNIQEVFATKVDNYFLINHLFYRLLLSLGVFDKNLISISKLIFKLTRCENNDAIFFEEKIVHSLLSVINKYVLADNGMAFVYCIGALKVLSANTDNNIGDVLVQYGVFQVLERHLVACNTDTTMDSELKSNLLIQILGALRNLCDIPSTEKQLEESDILTQLNLTLTQSYSDPEVLLNGCRLLSRMSLFSGICENLSHSTEILNLLLKVVDNYTNDPQLLLRACFVLGNVTGQYTHAAIHLHENGAVLDSLLELCKVYKAKLGEKSTKEKQNVTKDVLCKAVRVLTNVLQNEAVAVSVSPHLIKMFISLGQLAAQNKIHEIVVNVLCGLNNMSFYNGEGSVFVKHRNVIADFVIRLLAINHTAVTVEALGVLGNLTQYHDVAEKVCEDKHVVDIAATLIDSENSELVYKACGLLVNVSKSKEFHEKLPKNIVSQVVDVVTDVGMLDTQLSTVSMYLLWNILSLGEMKVSEEDRDNILSLLTDYTDTTYCDNAEWTSNFHPVAKQLMRLLDSESDLQPL